jgi:hypothetical protein
VLLSEETTTRAISLDSVTHTPAPFPPDSPVRWGADGRTRIEVFAMNLALQPNEDASVVTAEAEDASGARHALKVEFVGPVKGFEWMTLVVLRLADDLTDVGDVLVSISYQGATSNRVRVGIGHDGGGPPDDAGARPTPPRLISGRILQNGAAFGGVKILVTGSQTFTLTTEADGSYSFIAAPLADYSLQPQLDFFDFDPPTQTFVGLDDNKTEVDFNAVRQTRAVFGQVHDDEGRELFNYGVRLTGGQGFAPQATTTDDSGQFSFFNVPAGFNYTVSPVDASVVGFAPEKIAQLTENVFLAIRGTRRRFALSGLVTDYRGAVAGVTVELEESGRKATTDAAGRYRFDGVAAGLPFVVDVSSPDYSFDKPTLMFFEGIQSDTVIDYHATPQFTLSGRVTDAGGKGVFGVYLNVSGEQSGTTYTHADGTYTIVVNRYGDYTVTPAREQGYYTFNPSSRSLTLTKSARADDITSTLTQTFSPSHVIEFDGTPMTIDYGIYWEEAKPLGHFFWECWAMPSSNTSGGYMISDGYGGAHAILFGFGFLDGSEPNHYQLSGNTWDGTLVTFASDEGPQPGEWGHFAVGWDGQYINTYFDGVPVGRNKFTGHRTSGLSINGAGHLLVGGSDHSNFSGRIAQISGYEGTNPREGDGTDATLPYASFAPQTIFGLESNFLTYFFRAADPLSDLSRGYTDKPHYGFRRGTLNSYLLGCDGCPIPRFVVDQTAPDFSNPNNPGGTPAPAPATAAIPSGALVFDSFSRRNSTYILGGTGGLGSTEGGSAGVRAWQTGVTQTSRQPFGILNGRAVVLSNTNAVAWVDTGGAKDVEVRADRRPRPFGSGQNTGVSFRVADAANYFFAYTSEGPNQTDPKKLTVGYYLNGVRTDLANGIEMPNNPQSPWITLRVLTRANGQIQVLAGATPVFSTTSNVLLNATDAGLYNNAPGLGLTNRWDNFTVFPI